MATYLLDTNVISEFTRRNPATGVIQFLEANDLDSLYVADVVLAETAFGLSLIADHERRLRYEAVLNGEVRRLFDGRVLSVDEKSWMIWKQIEWAGRKRGYTFPQPDLVLASLAIQHDCTVVTRDVSPFREANVPVFNPWMA